MIRLAVISAALTLTPTALATGGWYDEAGFHEAGEMNVGAQLCADHGGLVSEESSGPDTIVSCADGTRFIIRQVPPMPTAEYVPDIRNDGECVDGHYDEDGYVEQVCP